MLGLVLGLGLGPPCEDLVHGFTLTILLPWELTRLLVWMSLQLGLGLGLGSHEAPGMDEPQRGCSLLRCWCGRDP